MESSVEVPKSSGRSNPKPALAPKPALVPKPFSVQRNTTIRSIHAPKTSPASSKTQKSDGTGVSKPTSTTVAQKPSQPTATSNSEPGSQSTVTQSQPKPTEATKPKPAEAAPQKEETLSKDSSVGKSASQTTPPEETKKSVPVQKNDVVQTNHKVSGEPELVAVNTEQKDGKKKEDEVSGEPELVAVNTEQKDGKKKEDKVSEKPPLVAVNSEQKDGKKKEDKVSEKPPLVAVNSEQKDGKKKEDKVSEKPPLVAVNSEQKDGKTKEDKVSEKPPLVAVNSEQKDGKKKEDDTQASVVQMQEHSGSDGSSSTDETFHWRGARKRLSTKLTSKFESGGVFVPPQPTTAISTANTKGDSNKPASSAPEQKQTVPEPSNGESDEGEPKEDYTGGTSIKRRISQLFDSRSRPEVTPKREEPEILNGIAGVKERIKNWAVETSSEGPKTEKTPQAASPTQSKTFEPVTSPTTLKSPKTSVLRPFAQEQSPSPTVDPPSKLSPAEEPTKETLKGEETSLENTAKIPEEQNKSPESDLQSHSLDPSEDIPKKINVKRRSVRFGTVQSDDGSPPLVLGSDTDSDSKEEEEEEEEGPEEDVSVTVPVYKRVGILQKSYEESQKQAKERLKHLEFDNRRQAEEKEQAKLMLEKDQKRDEGEREKEMARQRDEDRLKEEEREKQKEEQIKKEKREERLKEEERKEEERKKQIEKERLEMERRIQLEKEEEMERLRQLEKQREEERREEERKRQIEKERLEMEKRIQRENEEEMERLRELEKQREEERREEERKRQIEKERIEMERKIQREKEEEMARLRQLEKQREEERREEERKRQTENERIEMERKIQREKEEEMERLRQLEKQREEERREEERKRQVENERIEMERKIQREKEEEMARLRQLEKQREEETRQIEREIQNQKSESPDHLSPNTNEPTESLIDIVYDDFSVKQPQLDIEFDDFSVKPVRVTSLPKTETTPVLRTSWVDFMDKEKVEELVSLDVKTEEDEVEKPAQHVNAPALKERQEVEERKDEPEEERLLSLEVEEEEKEADTEIEYEVKQEDEQEDQVNNFSTTNEGKDTDALIDFKPDTDDGVWEDEPESSSPQPVPDQVPEVSSEDTADTQKEPEVVPFPESSAPLLDTSAQRSKANLGKRLIRTRPSRLLRAGLVQKEPTVDWRAPDSDTDEKKTPSNERETDSEEEQPKPKVACSSNPRVPVFPGMSPAGLLEQLKKRTGGGGTEAKEETVENKAREEREPQDEEVALSPSELPRSPRMPAHLAGATRVLPPIGGKEGGASSPAWLQELKSKKRMSQHGSDA